MADVGRGGGAGQRLGARLGRQLGRVQLAGAGGGDHRGGRLHLLRQRGGRPGRGGGRGGAPEQPQAQGGEAGGDGAEDAATGQPAQHGWLGFGSPEWGGGGGAGGGLESRLEPVLQRSPGSRRDSNPPPRGLFHSQKKKTT